MNGQDGISVSVRGTTEIVGVVVLVGMVITSATLLFVFATDAKRDIEQEIEAEEGIRQAQTFDDTATDVSIGARGDGERIDLGGVPPGRVHVVDAGTLEIRLDASDGGTPCSVTVPMSAVVVDVNDQVDVVYFAGGVFRVDDGETTVETPPNIEIDDSGTLRFSTYNFRGDFDSREEVVSRNDTETRRLNDEIRDRLLDDEACQEHLDGSVDNVSVTTTIDPSGGPAVATDALNAVVPAYQRHVAEELGVDPTVSETAGGTVVGAELSGDDLPAEADPGRNRVVDLVGDGAGSVDDGTDSVTVDKDAGNDYPVSMTVLATDARNVTTVTETVVVPTPVDDVTVPRQQEYRTFEDRSVDARLADPAWEPVSLEGDRRTEAPDFEGAETDLYRTRTVYEYQDVEADNAFEQREVERVDAEEQDPLEVTFVVDQSGSMSGYRIGEAKGAMQGFVDVLRDSATESAAARDHRVSVVGFSSYYDNYYRSDVVEEMTTDYNDVDTAIRNLRAGGDTPLWQGVQRGLVHNRNTARDDTNQVVVVLTDGEHNYPNEEFPNVGPRIDYAQDNDITVHTVGVHEDESELDSDELERLADRTGGNYTYVSSADELDSVFDRIVRDEITSNVTVRDPAPAETVEMLVLPENESFDGDVPDDGVLTRYDGRDVVIRPDGDAERVSMAREDEGLVRVHYASRNDTYFYLNGTDPVGTARRRGAADRTVEDDVVPEDPASREERVETDVDQTVEIAAYEETPDEDEKPPHDLELERDGTTVYLSVADGTLETTAQPDRIRYVADDGATYYFDLADGMIPEPGTTERWVGPEPIPTPVDVQVLDGGDAPSDAEYVAEVDGQRLALTLGDDDWELRRPSEDVPVFLVTDDETTYRFDLRSADGLPGDTTTWVPSETSLDVIAYDAGDAPTENDDVVGADAVELTVDGTNYVVRPDDGATLRDVGGGEYVLETADERYRFAAENLTAIDETTATAWYDAGTAELNMTVYEDDVPADATGLEVPVGDVTAVVRAGEDWTDVAVDENSIRYEVDGERYDVTIGEADLPDESDRTEAEERVAARQVYDRPMTIDVSVGGETETSPWTDADSGIGADVTALTGGERSTTLTMSDGQTLSFDAHVGDCDYEDREATGGTIGIGDDPTEYTRARCTAMEDRAAVDEIHTYTDGETIVAGDDAADWQTDLTDAIGSQYVDDGTVNVSDNQVLVVVENDDPDAAYNYAAVLVEVGRESPDVGGILEVEVNRIEIEEDDEDD